MHAATREQALGFRVRRQGLDAEPGAGDPSILAQGLQDTGTDGAAWALANRGVDAGDVGPLALAWTLRGAPHAYRRDDLDRVAVATCPWSDADAATRVFDAAKPLKAAGIPVLQALRRVAEELRDLAAEPIAKGDASGALTERLPRPFLRDCRPCGATHVHEQPFRLAALQAGLELEPGTSPPVLRRAPGLEPRLLGDAGAPADPDVDPVRGHLRWWGPTTPADVAGFVDAPVKEVAARWPGDAVEVEVDGRRAWVLAEDVEALLAAGRAVGATRLLGPYDPLLQARDRELLVQDAARRKELWPVLGRPGAALLDGEVVGSWRAKRRGSTVTVDVRTWAPLAPEEERALAEQAERLADHRGVRLAAFAVAEG